MQEFHGRSGNPQSWATIFPFVLEREINLKVDIGILTQCALYLCLCRIGVFSACCGHFQVSEKIIVESVTFHTDVFSATYFAPSAKEAAHILYLSQDALKIFWRDSPTAWGLPRANIAPVAVYIGGRAVRHVGSSRGRLPPLVCSRMSAELKSVKHNEVDFERPELVTAMEDTVRESDVRHTVIKKTLVRLGASECCVATFLCSLGVRSFRV